MRRLATILLLGAVVLAATGAVSQAGPTDVLFVSVGTTTTYQSYGEELRDMLTSFGASVDYHFLSPGSALPYDPADYGQVWVYDLSYSTDDDSAQAAAYSAVASWYNGLPGSSRNLIADGRIISSTTYNTAPAELGYPANHETVETRLIRNYYELLRDNGGGLLLGTDHAIDFTRGINEINSGIGIDPFTGYFYAAPFLAEADPLSPLMANGAPHHTQGDGTEYVWDYSSTSIVPTNVQPNGQVLFPVAWHADQAFGNAAISTTFGSQTFPDLGVPEPGTIALFATGLLGLGVLRRRRRRA